MESLSTWENLMLSAAALLVIFWMSPGIKASMEKSKAAKSDWRGLLVPLALIVLFVLFLIGMVKPG